MNKENSVFKKTVLDSGLTIVSEQLPYVWSVSLGFWARTGSRNESEENNGISHFLEHMVFKGTPKRKSFEIAESLESLGGTINAYTGKETTCFFAHVLDEHLPLAIDVLSDIVQDPLLKENDIEKEKLVIAEEINSINDNPEELIYDYFHDTIFKGNSLAAPILGKIENVRNFSRNDLLNYWERNYKANNFIVAACGNLKHDELVNLVKEYVRLPGSENKISYDKPVDINNRFLNTTKKIFQSHSCLGYKSISYIDDRKFALLVLNTFFGNGMSSRLFQNIREKCGFTYSVYSFTDFYSDIGDFGVYMAFDKNKREEALNRVKEEFLKLHKKEISVNEIERAKSQLKGNIMLGLENTASRMFRLGKMEIYLGKYSDLDAVLKQIGEVDESRIYEIIDEIVDMDKIIEVVLEPD